MEQRVRDLLGEYGVTVTAIDPSDVATQLAIRLAEAERATEAAAGEVQKATEQALDLAKAGDLRTTTRGSLMAAIAARAAEFDAALVQVAERRYALALVAQAQQGTASN
jgi:NAD(P)-dependent dehydrogenase (short-subunit alcohol dehydrogenase family)